MHLRLARHDDVPAIMELVRRVVPVMRAAGNLQWDDAYPNSDAFLRDIGLHQLWLAEVEGKLAAVAAITTEQDPEYANVGWDIQEPAVVTHRLLVDPALRGQGIGAAMMQHAETIARERGIAALRIDTSTENPVTQRLFPKLGYILCGETHLAHRPGLRVLCYEKRL